MVEKDKEIIATAPMCVVLSPSADRVDCKLSIIPIKCIRIALKELLRNESNFKMIWSTMSEPKKSTNIMALLKCNLSLIKNSAQYLNFYTCSFHFS